MVQVREVFSGFAVPDVAAAKTFYSDVLGLDVGEEHGMLHITLPNGASVLAYPKPDHQPANYTMLNLVVEDLPGAVDELVGKGAEFIRYDGFDQDDRGIMAGNGHGPDIAWTSDPGGNIIGVMAG